jgi:rhamnosyltransferase
VHWSANDEVSDDDICYVEALAALGKTIIFVSNANSRRTNPWPLRLRKSTHAIIQRSNRGYDFGGYSAGFEYLVRGNYLPSEVIFCNNSVVLLDREDLRAVLELSAKSNFDLTSLTSSNEIAPHLQSYWLHFKAVEGYWHQLLEFWSELDSIDAKNDVVLKQEIPLARFFKARNIKTGALFTPEILRAFSVSSMGQSVVEQFNANTRLDFAKIVMRNGSIFNPTHHAFPWLRALGFPFMKKDLISKNPQDLPWCNLNDFCVQE